YGLIHRVVGVYADYRTEDLLGGYMGIDGWIEDDCRLEAIVLELLAATGDDAAGTGSLGHPALDTIDFPGGDQGPDIGGLIGRVADFELARLGGDETGEMLGMRP